MSPLEQLRWAVAPVPTRSVSLVLGAVMVMAIAGLLATYYELPQALGALLALLMLAAWLVGVCGMVGYFRWFFNPKSHLPSASETNHPKE